MCRPGTSPGQLLMHSLAFISSICHQNRSLTAEKGLSGIQAFGRNPHYSDFRADSKTIPGFGKLGPVSSWEILKTT